MVDKHIYKFLFLKNWEWILNFIKCFFVHLLKLSYNCILYSINVVNYLVWYSFPKLTLYFWNKLILIMVYILLYIIEITEETFCSEFFIYICNEIWWNDTCYILVLIYVTIKLVFYLFIYLHFSKYIYKNNVTSSLNLRKISIAVTLVWSSF